MKKSIKHTHIEARQSIKMMLVILGVIFFSILFIGTISASTIDDWKTYNEVEREYTITNYFGLGKYFGIGEIAKVQLITPDSFNVAWGTKRFAEFEIQNGEYNYNDIIKGTELYDLENNSNQIFRNINYKYKRIIQVPKYSWACPKDDGNNLTKEVCTKSQDGTKDKIVWEDWTNETLLKGENITIGIYTDVKKGDVVEWVINIYGNERLTKWAIFNATIDVGLVGSYPTNESTGTNIKDYGSGGNDGTTNGMEDGDWTGSSLEFDGVEEYANLTTLGLSLNGTDELTIAFNFTPFNVSATSANQALLDDIYDISLRSNFEFKITSSTSMSNFGETTLGKGICNSAGSPNILGGGFVLVNGVSHTLVQVINHSGQWSFLDGNLTDHTSCVGVNGTYFSEVGVSNVTLGAENFGVPDVFFNGSIGNINFWNRSLSFEEIQEVTKIINGSIKLLPIITLNSPVDSFSKTNQTIDFNASVTSQSGIINVSLFIEGVLNETNSSGINNTDYLFTKNFASGNHNWSYESCNVNGCRTSDSRTFTIDNTNPAFTITFPNETIDFHEMNINLSVNWTVSDPNLDSCTLEYEGVNTTVTCLDNNTNINITNSVNRSLIFYVNDTFGNSNSSSVSWNYKIFQNSLDFNITSIGGSTEDFTLNITKLSSLQISTVDLVYNLSISSASFTSGDTSIITKILDVPNPATDSNFSFYFSFLMSDSSIINSTTNNQTVLTLSIGNCSTFSTLIYNFTMFDEVNQTKLTNVMIDYAFNLFDDSRTTKIANFSLASTANPTQICINQNLTSSSSYSLDAVLKYLSSDAMGYLTRYYNILNFTLSNSTIPNNISIYAVIEDTATPFQLTFRDRFLALAPNILVNVNKQFVASNDFKTVEIPITDTNGQTILNLERNVGIYNLIFIDVAGNIVATFNKITAFCQDFTIGECTFELDAQGAAPRTFNLTNSTAISYTLEYTNSTSTATLTFNSINSTPVTARIIGTTQNQFGNQSVCDSSLTSILGTVNCDASSILLTDNYLFIDIFSNEKFVETRVVNISPARPLIGGIFGKSGFFIAFLVMLTIIMLFSNDKQTLLVMVGLGWATILILGLVKGAIIGSISGGIWLIITIAIMLWKLKEEDKGI